MSYKTGDRVRPVSISSDGNYIEGVEHVIVLVILLGLIAATLL